MDIRQLRYFCAVAEEGQVTKAAERLHMAQPPLSQQLKNMEEELDIDLFQKNGRNIELTEAGKILYHKALKIMHELEDTVTEVQEIDEGIRGTLTIGSNKSCFSFLPEQMNQMRERHPHIIFKLREGDTFYLAESIRNREIELAVVRLPVDPEEFHMLPLPSERYVLVLPGEWNTFAAHRKNVDMKEIGEMPLMLLHRISGAGQFELIVNECRRHGNEPNVICECPDASMLLSLTAAGLGATIIPKSTLYAFSYENIRVMNINDFSITADPALIWNKDRYLTKAAQRFIDLFASSFSPEGKAGGKRL
ncbi:LysR family transcriptional regulator [Salibacterium qingdaonense]|uniref:DNA-binding transcriptional regulator, LysR family n=1 Tax=Salibacterium qingdaonense TaxID=266892 RepID=A0A1I4HYL3_9BACI|nr:LysR family transcriptional regulator [Salibacterium qingdaonense]SFL47232.1 DNA-binding transcriptional regulator, LysR family [Salibacterium qingdaonense]